MEETGGGGMDVTGVTTEIAALATPVAAIGAAMLLVYVAIKGWKVIKQAL